MVAFYASVHHLSFYPLLSTKALEKKSLYERYELKDNYMKLQGIILALFLKGMVCNSNTKGA